VLFEQQTLDSDAFLAMNRSCGMFSCPDFPKLSEIRILRSTIDGLNDQTALENMLSSHPVDSIMLGGSFGVKAHTKPNDPRNGSLDLVDITDNDLRTVPIKTWLAKNVQNVTYLSRNHGSSLELDVWHL
jgi:hypothetical protein